MKKSGMSALRNNMKKLGFSSSSQTFCVANPLKLSQAIERQLTTTTTKTKVPASEVADPRLLAFLALKHAKPLTQPPPSSAISSGGDDDANDDANRGTGAFYLNEDLKALLLDAAEKYPDQDKHAKQAQEASGVKAAGLGVGGGQGKDHPAVKLLASEKRLLLETAEAL